MSLNRELVSDIDSREEGPVGRERFSDVRKLFNDSLNTYFPATRVELTFFSIRSVPLSDNQGVGIMIKMLSLITQGNTGITATLLSMKKSQVPRVSNPSCFCEWIAAFALKKWEVSRGVAQMARRLKIPQSPQSCLHSLWGSREDQSRQSPLAKGCWPHASARAKMHVFS